MLRKWLRNLGEELELRFSSDEVWRLRAFVQRGRVTAARKLLDADPSAVRRTYDSPGGLSLLCEAAMRGNRAMVEMLLAAGADREVSSIGPREGSLWRTPQTASTFAFVDGIKNALVFAWMSGDAATYRLLLDGASNTELGLALVAACRARDAAWIEELLARGAPASFELRYDGARPLHTCILLRFMPGFERLIAAGADVNIALDPVEMDPDHDRPAYDYDRMTPLYLAAEAGDLAMVEALLAAGARPDHGRAVDATPLMVAFERGDVAIARRLILHGANKLARCPRFFEGRTVEEEHRRVPTPEWSFLVNHDL